jgi:predicted nucleotidyltransferase
MTEQKNTLVIGRKSSITNTRQESFMRLNEEKIMTEKDFQKWLQETVRRWPEIESIYLTGSRARGYHREDSDYDLIICLAESYYETETRDGYRISRRKDDTELRMIHDIVGPGLDIFFYRPDGHLRRHIYLDGVCDLEMYYENMEILADASGSIKGAMDAGWDGFLMGDFDMLYKSLKYAKELYKREQEAL